VRTRGAQLSDGYTVNTHKMVARYALHIFISPAPHTVAADDVDLFTARTDGHQPTSQSASKWQYPAESWEFLLWLYQRLHSLLC